MSMGGAPAGKDSQTDWLPLVMRFSVDFLKVDISTHPSLCRMNKSIWNNYFQVLPVLVRRRRRKTWVKHWESTWLYLIVLIRWTTEVWEEFTKDLHNQGVGDVSMSSIGLNFLCCLLLPNKYISFSTFVACI